MTLAFMLHMASQSEGMPADNSRSLIWPAACAQVDSARKLRWYDREDLAPLVEVTTREKQALQDTLAALRQVIIALPSLLAGPGSQAH
jgi:hypothetical protein